MKAPSVSNRLFVGNFAFEHELSARQSTRHSDRIALELGSVWLSIARENDGLWMPEPPDAEFSEHSSAQGFPAVHFLGKEAELAEILKHRRLACCPWGWSAGMRHWAEKHRLEVDAPPVSAVAAANSRRFSFGLESELGMGLQSAAQIGTAAECETALAQFSADRPWVLKSEFGMSARERLLGMGPSLSAAHAAWAGKRFAAGEVLILEPWVEIFREAGLQFDVPRLKEGEPRLLGVTPLFTDRSGVYRGSRFDPAAESESDWSEAVQIGHIAAERIQSLGYFGPLGLDAAWYRDENEVAKLRPLQDINARWTMGRLSLGFRSRLAENEAGAWLHLRCPAKTPADARDWWTALAKDLPTQTRLVRTSPITTGHQVTRHGTALVIASDPSILQSAVRQLHSAEATRGSLD